MIFGGPLKMNAPGNECYYTRECSSMNLPVKATNSLIAFSYLTYLMYNL